jgi:hypothetical protein
MLFNKPLNLCQAKFKIIPVSIQIGLFVVETFAATFFSSARGYKDMHGD